MKQLSIDIETLGTTLNSAIVQIGACEFDMLTGKIVKTFSVNVQSDLDAEIICTKGTIMFWLQQVKGNPKAANEVFFKHAVDLPTALSELTKFIDGEEYEVWANGTKFDLGMLEYQYKLLDLPVPWKHNADRCMRTLRMLCGHIDVDMGTYKEMCHTGLSDAIWQAKYIYHAMGLINIKDI